MGRRIEVELTSSRDDGTWTWRAAGAKQPKGVVDASLLYDGARVGDVVRAEADFEIEGISITAVLPPKDKKRTEPERLEIIGPPREHQGVTSSLVAKSDRPRPERGHGRDRDGGRPGRDGTGDGARRGGPSRPREGAPATPRRSSARPAAEGRPGEGRPRGEHAPAGGRRGERPSRAEGARPEGRDRRPAPQAEPAAPKAKRLVPANVHRAAVVETLPPEQRPVAEQILRGGIPAVRQAIDAQNARLREQGQSEVQAAPLVALAEQLLPQLKAAEWRDRAEAAAKVVDEVSLRDLRSVVAGADSARDDESRLLAGTLRQALERRVHEQRERWVLDITGALDEGRLVRALRLSAHPPDPATRFPAELAVRLSEAAGAAMTPDATPDRWATLLDAVTESPVRRTVKPAGLPAEPGEALLHAAHQASGRVPALAPLLGIPMPPPPGPPRAGRPPTRGRPPGPPGARRRPPAPPSSPGAAPQAATVTQERPARAGQPSAPEPAPPVTAPTAAAEAGPPVEPAPEATPEAPVGATGHANEPAPAPEPTTATATEPATDTTPEPATVAEAPTAPEPATDTRPEPPSAAAPEPATDTRPEPPSAAAPEPATDTEPEPEPPSTAARGPEPPSTAAPEPATDTRPEPPSAAADEPATEPEPEPATAPTGTAEVHAPGPADEQQAPVPPA